MSIHSQVAYTNVSALCALWMAFSTMWLSLDLYPKWIEIQIINECLARNENVLHVPYIIYVVFSLCWLGIGERTNALPFRCNNIDEMSDMYKLACPWLIRNTKFQTYVTRSFDSHIFVDEWQQHQQHHCMTYQQHNAIISEQFVL